jgi:hypothetical protein
MLVSCTQEKYPFIHARGGFAVEDPVHDEASRTWAPVVQSPPDTFDNELRT